MAILQEERDPALPIQPLTLSIRLVACLVLAALAGCAPPHAGYSAARTRALAIESGGQPGGLSDISLRRVLGYMAPADQAQALRVDPIRHPRFWGRPVGWAVYDIDHLPSPGFVDLSKDEARRVNALIPTAPAAIAAARPFVLHASEAEAAKARECLAKAVYYEAASEPDQGQAAVAQTVLNRVRDPGFPKSVCGVVFQGSGLPTGCQFSFTCDGSLSRQPSASGWARAMAVAKRALRPVS